MRTRGHQPSTSLTFAKSIGIVTLLVSASAAVFGGACGTSDPATTTGGGGAGTSSTGGNGGDGLSDFTTSSNSSTGGVVSSSSGTSGGPKCPMPDPNGGGTSFAKAFGDPAAQTGAAVHVDKSGNILVAGSFGGTINFGGTTLTSAGMDDVYLAKFSSSGQLLWAKQFGDGNVQVAAGIGSDADGNVYLTGNFKGSINLGGGNLNYAGVLYVDIFLAKFTPDGTHVWSQKYGDEFVQHVRGLSVDSQGNVIIVGNFQQTVNFGGAVLTSAGGYDAFIAKYTSGGMHQWSRRYGDAGDQYARSVAIDTMGNVHVAGDMQGAVDFGGGAMTATGDPSAFVAKLDPLGNATWVKVSAGEAGSSAVANTVHVGETGLVAVGGKFKGAFDLGGGKIDNPSVDDAFVTLFDGSGAHQYTRSFGNPESQTTNSVAVSKEGDVFVAGNFTGDVDLGAGPVATEGGFDIFLARLDATGCPLWQRFYGGAMIQSVQAIALDPTTGGVAVTGSFNGPADFGTGLVSPAGDDVFLVSVKP